MVPGDLISVRTTGHATRCVGESPGPRESYRVGARVFEGGLNSIGAPQPTVYARSAGKCAATPLQTRLLPPDVNRLELIDPAQLVSGAASTVELGGGLALQRLVAQDETQITLALLGVGGLPCSLQEDGRCVPEPIAHGSRGFYLDDRCSQEGFDISAIETCGRTPLGVRTIDGVVHVYQLVLNEGAFVSEANACRALGSPNNEVFRAGLEVTSRYPKATVLQTGSGDLHVTRFSAPNGSGALLDSGGTFRDAQGYACSVKAAVDGSLRCLPDRALVNEANYGKDPTCKERLYVAADANVERSELRLVDYEGPSYTLISALFALTPHEGSVYESVAPECIEVERPALPLLAKGAALPLSTLPVVTATEL